MNRVDDEPLWDVLGHAQQPQVSPFFARDVLRRIRQEPRWTTALKSWLNPGKLIPASVAAIALVVALVLTQHTSVRDEPAGSDLDPVIAGIDAQDFEVVADLDDLLASDDNNNLWDDNDNSSL
jgi:hypothetical protein